MYKNTSEYCFSFSQTVARNRRLRITSLPNDLSAFLMQHEFPTFPYTEILSVIRYAFPEPPARGRGRKTKEQEEALNKEEEDASTYFLFFFLSKDNAFAFVSDKEKLYSWEEFSSITHDLRDDPDVKEKMAMLGEMVDMQDRAVKFFSPDKERELLRGPTYAGTQFVRIERGFRTSTYNPKLTSQEISQFAENQNMTYVKNFVEFYELKKELHIALLNYIVAQPEIAYADIVRSPLLKRAYLNLVRVSHAKSCVPETFIPYNKENLTDEEYQILVKYDKQEIVKMISQSLRGNALCKQLHKAVVKELMPSLLDKEAPAEEPAILDDVEKEINDGLYPSAEKTVDLTKIIRNSKGKKAVVEQLTLVEREQEQEPEEKEFVFVDCYISDEEYFLTHFESEDLTSEFPVG